jgi:putative transposase
MLEAIGLLLSFILRCFRARRSLLLENRARRHQLAVFKRKHSRPRFSVLDRLVWVIARRFWSGWKQALIIVAPETVVRWHRAGFLTYWKLISKVKRPMGRKPIPKEVRHLIFRMVRENPTWGAPRIHGELLMLGLAISERTISRWMKRAPRDPEPAKRWLTSLPTTADASCTSTSQNIRQVCGWYSNCGKLFRSDWLLDS